MMMSDEWGENTCILEPSPFIVVHGPSIGSVRASCLSLFSDRWF
jgi:hypothetical protein